MSEILQFIKGSSIDLALQLSRIISDEHSNTINEDFVSTLTAIRLFDALVKAGASFNKRNQNRRHVLLSACKAVDPINFNKILQWNSMKKEILQNWWTKLDDDRNGVFILACASENFDLVQNVLSIASKNVDVEDSLNSKSNFLLDDLKLEMQISEENFPVGLIRLSREFIQERYSFNTCNVSRPRRNTE
jgi:hypothetical protein